MNSIDVYVRCTQLPPIVTIDHLHMYLVLPHNEFAARLDDEKCLLLAT